MRNKNSSALGGLGRSWVATTEQSSRIGTVNRSRRRKEADLRRDLSLASASLPRRLPFTCFGSWAGIVMVFLLAGLGGYGADPGHALDPTEVITGAVDGAAGRARLSFRGQPLMTYAFAAAQYKPYVQALHSLRGENVIRDAPSDHLHHHGLMYAIRVNGVNFWEERPPAGRQSPVAPPSLALGKSAAGLPEAVLVQDLNWQTPAESGGTTLLRERREIRVTVNPGVEEVALEWRASFEVDRGVERAVLHGADYLGLGMRLPETFDKVAEFQNSEGVPYSEAQTWDVRPAAWTAVSGRVSGREAMLVLAGHPSNAGVSSFFSMRNAFAYLTATQSLGREPIHYPSGAKFQTRYLLLVYPAAQNRAYLTERLTPWLKGR